MEHGRTIGPVEESLHASGNTEFYRLCDMQNHELLQFIDDYLETPDAEYDLELFKAAKNLLSERAPIIVDIDVNASLAQFKRDHVEFFPDSRERSDSTPAKDTAQEGNKAVSSTGKVRRSNFHRVALVAVGVAATVMLAAYAANPEFFQPVTDLGDRVIRFINWGPSGQLELPENVAKYNSLREALDATGAEDAQAPTWMPQDLGLTDIRTVEIDEESEEKSYWAMFLGNERDLLFHIEMKLPTAESYFDEKDENTKIVFVRDGISYHTVTNLGVTQVNWENGNFKYSIAGKLSQEEYLQIIDSLE